MAKALCIVGMVIAVLLFALFLVDMVIGWPFGQASILMDVVFVICAAGLGYMSWATYKEQP
jgi:hypothetical protein